MSSILPQLPDRSKACLEAEMSSAGSPRRALRSGEIETGIEPLFVSVIAEKDIIAVLSEFLTSLDLSPHLRCVALAILYVRGVWMCS